MWCSRAGKANWNCSDLRLNFTDVVISMLQCVGTGSEVTREIWEMKLLTLLPRLELGSSGTSGGNANRVIWKPCFARVCDSSCFGEWLQSLFSTLMQLVVRSQSLCGQCFASLSTFLSNWYSAAVSANPWNELHYVLRVTASQFLFSWKAVSCGVPCPCSRVGKTFLFVASTLGILGSVHHGCCSRVISLCFIILLEVLRIKLHLVFALGGCTSICGNISTFSCLGMICCLCVRRHGST